jgi:hypothetical protein
VPVPSSRQKIFDVPPAWRAVHDADTAYAIVTQVGSFGAEWTIDVAGGYCSVRASAGSVTMAITLRRPPHAHCSTSSANLTATAPRYTLRTRR